MNKDERRQLIKQLVEKRSTSKKIDQTYTPAKKPSSYVAYVDPSESDILDELVRLSGYVSTNK